MSPDIAEVIDFTGVYNSHFVGEIIAVNHLIFEIIELFPNFSVLPYISSNPNFVPQFDEYLRKRQICASSAHLLPRVRGRANASSGQQFLPAVSAIESTRDAGIAPVMVEVVVAKDGSVTYRVYGEDAVPTPASAEPGVSKEWQDENEKLKQPK
jgi:hypothetical protein